MPKKKVKLSKMFLEALGKHRDEDLISLAKESKKQYENMTTNFQDAVHNARTLHMKNPSPGQGLNIANKKFKANAQHDWTPAEPSLHEFERPGGEIKREVMFPIKYEDYPKSISEGAHRVRMSREFMKAYSTEAARRKLKIPND